MTKSLAHQLKGSFSILQNDMDMMEATLKLNVAMFRPHQTDKDAESKSLEKQAAYNRYLKHLIENSKAIDDPDANK